MGRKSSFCVVGFRSRSLRSLSVSNHTILISASRFQAKMFYKAPKMVSAFLASCDTTIAISISLQPVLTDNGFNLCPRFHNVSDWPPQPQD